MGEVTCRSRQEGKQQELVWSSSQQVLKKQSQVLGPAYDGAWILKLAVTDTGTSELLGVLECEEGGR